jgi:Arc/MetJ-type ribon-helix-helix transcriptional regulator
MAIQLTPEQEQRIQAVVQAGAYRSAEEALDAAVAAVECVASAGFEGKRGLGVAGHAAGGPEGPLRSAAEMILQRMRKLPPEAFEGLPADGASQHAHYIYGSPKTEQ